ncbi:MAG: PASTA domain-containing protein [Candidatus Calescibacterium sp.]|nr:PASTA domain-containing protein [Candidatus Calescibacterium sp.]MDW8132267.1 PASTA domain-containing protein [Candidatus Calescibacterium sp.]
MKFLNILVSIIFILLLAVSLFFIYRFFYGESDDLVVVPNIINMDVYTAQENVRLVDLKVEVVSTTFSDKPANTVVKQYPEPGMEVKKNSIIKVVVSSGEKEVQQDIPNLVGKTLNQVISDPIINMFIKKHNLVLKTIYYPTLLVDDNQIMLQAPVAGFPKGKSINLLVSKKQNIDSIVNKEYKSLAEFLYNVNVDAILIDLNNTTTSQDRNIENIEVYNNSVIVNSDLNYSQIPSFRITNIYVKPTYTDEISFLEIVLEDFLGNRTILKQYYTGVFVCSFQVSYIGEAKIVIKIDGKKVSSYSLP